MLLPFEIAGDALSLQPEGSHTLPGFYTSFLETPLASGDAATVARFTPLRDWWRTACTVLEKTPRVNLYFRHIFVAIVDTITLKANRLILKHRRHYDAICEDSAAAASGVCWSSGIHPFPRIV